MSRRIQSACSGWYRNYHKHELSLAPIQCSKKALIFVNTITGDTISKKHVHLNYIESSPESSINSTITSLKKNKVGYSLANDTLKILSGAYEVYTDIKVDSKYQTIIEKNVILSLNEGVNLCFMGNIDIRGEEQRPVIIKNKREGQPFGAVTIIGHDNSSVAEINYLQVDGGSESYVEGRLFTGQFAVYNSTVTIRNSRFSGSNADDGLNIKYSKVVLDNCSFKNNLADQVDLDFCIAKVRACDFSPSLIDANGDGLDLSGSYTSISNCTFTNFLDKGLSLGEKSRVIVTDNSFLKNESAIAVKDQTTVYLSNNSYKSNISDVHAYIKKLIFDPPVVYSAEDLNSDKTVLTNGTMSKVNNTEIEAELSSFERGFEMYLAGTGLSNKHLLNQLIEE